MKGTHREFFLEDTAWQLLEQRRSIHKLIMMFKIINGLVPLYLQSLCPKLVSKRTTCPLHTCSNLSLPGAQTERFKRSFTYSSIQLWTRVSNELRTSFFIGKL